MTAAAPVQETLAQWAQMNIAGSFADANDAAQRLRAAAERCHLVGGATMPPLPLGHEVQITVVVVNKATTYKIKGKEAQGGREAIPDKFGIPKSALMQIANAAGVEWTFSKRQDDGRDGYFCHWKVRGRYRQIDGTWREIEGERDSDFRDGSAQLHAKSDLEILFLRQNIVRSTITKAKLRAIREAFGLEQGLTGDEIEKPFVFSKIVFTGRTKDKYAARLFAQTIAMQQLAASNALFGPNGMTTPQLGGGTMAALPGARTVFTAIDPEDDGDEGDEEEAPASDRHPAAAPPPPPPPPRPAAKPNGAAAKAGGANGGGFVIPGGRDKGKPLKDAARENLEWWAKRLSDSLDAGDSKYPAKDAALLKAMREELALRDRDGAVDQNDDPANGPSPEQHGGRHYDDPENFDR